MDVWEDLKECFSKVDKICISTMRYTINNIKQGSSYVLDYATKMKSMWEKIHSHRCPSNFTCAHPCCYDAILVAHKYLLSLDQII